MGLEVRRLKAMGLAARGLELWGLQRGRELATKGCRQCT
jgi:hypothetical protein